MCNIGKIKAALLHRLSALVVIPLQVLRFNIHTLIHSFNRKTCATCRVGTPIRRPLALPQAILLLLLATASFSHAKDLGVHGPLFEITEPSLLDTIHSRLKEMEAAGELDQMREEMQNTTRSYVERPRPVPGLGKAEEYATWDVDMSITLNEDLSDHKGQIFARAGTVVNPLAYSRFDKRIVLFDGDDPEQVSFALSRGNELDTLLVLVNGDPLGLMREHGRRFYFDQNAVLVDRFGVRNVPAVVSRADPVMRVEEVVVR
ncbi:type-F conjugative transfer system protein TraW [Ruegeria jejuensis]|uniref:type-F conjugative transfer system protein TraW n=1 Tax=Ruegeria jejuensis TaxID=3233338 RepID=UPI00355BB9C2